MTIRDEWLCRKRPSDYPSHKANDRWLLRSKYKELLGLIKYTKSSFPILLTLFSLYFGWCQKENFYTFLDQQENPLLFIPLPEMGLSESYILFRIFNSLKYSQQILSAGNLPRIRYVGLRCCKYEMHPLYISDIPHSRDPPAFSLSLPVCPKHCHIS